MKRFIFFALTVCYMSCSNGKIEFLKEIIPLHSEIIEMDCLIGLPHGITCIDSLLIFYDKYDQKVLTVFDKKNKVVIGRFISFGNGPGDVIVPLRGLYATQNELYTFESQTGNMVTLDIGDSMRIKEKKYFEQMPMELRKINNYFVGIGQTEGRFHVYDNNGNLLKYAGVYPFNEDKSGIEFSFLYQGVLCASSRYNCFAFGGIYCDDLEFYEIKENSCRLIKKYLTTDINAIWDDNRVHVDKNCIIHYTQSYGTEKYCYMLYSGKTILDNGGPVLGQYIIVFDWEGNHLNTFELDVSITSFCVDEDEQTIYATAYLDTELSIRAFKLNENHKGQVYDNKQPASSVENVKRLHEMKIICRGIILNENTQKPLPNVRITVNTDTVGIKSDKDGKFELSMKANDKLWFRLNGFLWKSIKVPDSDMPTIYLTPSDTVDMISTSIPGEITEIIFNGWSVPKDEWKDINPKEISDIEIAEKEGKIQIIIKSN